ncbi:hypothetical protein O6H91_Y223000 [Diphasiastrum complanatum]|nr:hypothetical protein O6H91_Y223000 [Diphasiastrum complanatum]
MVTIADLNNQWAAYAGPGGWNDPDMLEVGNGGMTLEEYRSHFSVWSLMKAPLLIGCDVRNVSKKYIDILTNVEVISVNQDSLGVQGKKVSQQGVSGCLEVWASPLCEGRRTVLLWNRCNITDSIIVRWADVGLQPSTVVTVRDIWQHENLPETFTQSLEVEVRQHSSKMYILTPLFKAEEDIQ